MDNYNNIKYKYALWAKEKAKEEKLLRKLGCDEDVISELYEYDKDIFKKDRIYHYWNYDISDYTLNNIPYNDHKEVQSFYDLLDVIEDDELFKQLIKLNRFEQELITYRLLGFTFDEISQILDIQLSTLYSRYKKMKKFLNSSKK